MDPDDVHVGPSDHVPWLLDRKWCYIRMEGTTFGDVPLNAELKLEVWDSPNSAGVITDAIRCLKLGLDRGLKGTLVAPSSYFMKSPPQQIHDDIAFNRVEAFIRGDDNETLVGTEAPAKRAAQARWPAPRPRSPPPRGDRRANAASRRPTDAAGRRASGPRLVERTAVTGYRATSWLLGGLPAGPAAAVIGRFVAGCRTSLWPTKRRWSNQNFGHVLGLPPDDPAGPPHGAARLPRVRPLPRRAHAPAVHAARRGRAAGQPTSTRTRSSASGATRPAAG